MTNVIADGDDCYGVAFDISLAYTVGLMMITENTEQNKVTLSQRMLFHTPLTYASLCSSLVMLRSGSHE